MLYGAGVTEAQRLTQAEDAARAAVAAYLRETSAYAEYPGLRYTIGFDATDHSVTVDVDAPLELPLTVPGSPERAMIGATGSAVVQVAPPNP